MATSLLFRKFGGKGRFVKNPEIRKNTEISQACLNCCQWKEYAELPSMREKSSCFNFKSRQSVGNNTNVRKIDSENPTFVYFNQVVQITGHIIKRQVPTREWDFIQNERKEQCNIREPQYQKEISKDRTKPTKKERFLMRLGDRPCGKKERQALTKRYKRSKK